MKENKWKIVGLSALAILFCMVAFIAYYLYQDYQVRKKSADFWQPSIESTPHTPVADPDYDPRNFKFKD